MQDYRNLQVWQKAHQLALGTYAISAYLQKPDGWPLRDQLFRAAISIPSNIAPAEAQIPIFEDSCGIPWVPVMNLSMICFLPEISGSCRWSCTGSSPDRWKKSDGCYRVWSNN